MTPRRLVGLFGVATALIASVANAQEGEPLGLDPREVVAICKGYGRGFFYIPGTATCLRLGGYVRFQVNAIEGIGEDDNESLNGRSRFNFDIDARNETDYGTLRAFTQLQFDYTATSADSDADPELLDDTDTGTGVRPRDAFIQLGGLTIGVLDTLWTASQYRINDGLLTVTDWSVGSFRTPQITLNYTMGEFAYGVSVEQPERGYVPSVVGRATYRNERFGAYAAAVYDPSFGAPDRFGFGFAGLDVPGEVLVLPPRDEDDNAVALKAGFSIYRLAGADNELRFEGSYATGPTRYAAVDLAATSEDLGVDSDVEDVAIRWAVGAGYRQSVGKFRFVASAQYGETFELEALEDRDVRGAADFVNVAFDVSYEVVEDLTVLVEVQHREVDLPGDGFGQTSGFMRWQRRF